MPETLVHQVLLTGLEHRVRPNDKVLVFCRGDTRGCDLFGCLESKAQLAAMDCYARGINDSTMFRFCRSGDVLQEKEDGADARRKYDAEAGDSDAGPEPGDSEFEDEEVDEDEAFDSGDEDR